MYRIRLPSGREAEFKTIEELALAVRREDVSRDALIYHRRSDSWVPIERHPYFQGNAEPDDAAEDPPAPEPLPPAPAMPTPPPPRAVERKIELEPVAPTPFPVQPAPPPPMAAARTVPDRTHAPEPPRRGPPPPLPEPALRQEPRPRKSGLLRALARLTVLGGLAAGAWFGWKEWEARRLADVATNPGFAPAPPPSTLIRPEAGDTVAAAPAVARPAARTDPRAPVSAAELIARHAASVDRSRQQLAGEMETIGFPLTFGPGSFASPLGARAGRRRIASALNVIGQFHRRTVLLDQAYGDTAAFQVSRAGWTAAERESWDTRPTLREPYASADLAESLLADADSLLAILGSAPGYTLRGDTLELGDPERTAAWVAQRTRMVERSGPPIDDFDRRPTLHLVRRSLDPDRIPVAVP